MDVIPSNSSGQGLGYVLRHEGEAKNLSISYGRHFGAQNASQNDISIKEYLLLKEKRTGSSLTGGLSQPPGVLL